MLVDMTKTSSDFRAAASKALEALADALLPRLRPIMDELGAVSCVCLLSLLYSCPMLPAAVGPSTQPALQRQGQSVV